MQHEGGTGESVRSGTAPAVLQEMLRARNEHRKVGLRCVFVYAHPDDESVGSSVLLTLPEDAVFVSATDGAPRNSLDALAAGFPSWKEYAGERRREWLHALARSGNRPGKSLLLGFADQEASLFLTELTLKLIELFRTVCPDVILTHPYEGGHPDHDAVAFSVRAACRWLHEAGHSAPCILESAFYRAGPGGMIPFEFLPGAGSSSTVMLTPEELKLKKDLFSCYDSQKETLSYFPLGFERFRPALPVDFSVPPHEGSLYYELQPWRMTWMNFREQVEVASRELGTGVNL